MLSAFSIIVRLAWGLLQWCGLCFGRATRRHRTFSRRLIHFNVTAHPTAQWTRQQLRETVGSEEQYAYLLHDRDSIFSTEVDESIQRLGPRAAESAAES